MLHDYRRKGALICKNAVRYILQSAQPNTFSGWFLNSEKFPGLSGSFAIKKAIAYLFSLRTVVSLLALAVLAGRASIPWLSVPDQLLFRLGWGLQHGRHKMRETLSWLPDDGRFHQYLQHSHLLSPHWTGPLERGMVVAVALFLILALPALRAGSGLLLTLLLSLLLFVAQLGAQLYAGLWLPLGAPLGLLLLGYLVMLFWLPNYWAFRRARADAGNHRLKLARMLLEQDRLGEAVATLEPCDPDSEVIEARYDIGIRLEKRRQYEQALELYRNIRKRGGRFRDVADRIAVLERLGSGAPGEAGELDATSTLVLTQQGVSSPTLGRYEIQRELGRGAMGIVYLAHDPRIDRPVAIKTLNYGTRDPAVLKDLKARFFREAEAAGRLKHPNIVTVYDVGEERDLAYIAMDYVRGRPLSVFGKPHTLLMVATVFQLMAQVADALEYAHRQKVIHRDIKPANIIYDPDTGELKVTDFGIAKVSDESRTRTGSVLGSPLYMAPEQLKGQKVTGASDIYSLGVTLFKLLTAETPFSGDTLANLTYQVLNRKPRSARELRPELPASAVRIINRAINRDPAKRFASAAEMAEQLRRAAGRELGRTTTC